MTMRVLSIGTDASVCDAGSASGMRQRAYTTELGHLDVVVLTKRESDTVREEKLAVYPAVSAWFVVRAISAYRIATSLQKPDVVSAQDPFETGLIGCLVAWYFNVPLHVQVHTDFLSPAYVQHSVLNKLRVWIAGFILRRATRIRVVSERVKISIAGWYRLAAPISVLPIFVDVEQLRSPKSDFGEGEFESFSTKLLVVSRLEKEKNVSLAIKSFAQAAPIDTCLIIIGDGRQRTLLEKLAGQLNVSDRVFFEGRQDPVPYYHLADLVLVPSLYEGYGLVIIEALAAGIPVLSTDVGVAKEAGAIVATPESFAAALASWFVSGPREGRLAGYPYASFDQYVRAYCDDVRACTKAD